MSSQSLPLDIRQIVRGMKAPCSWKNLDQESEEQHPPIFQVNPLFSEGKLPENVRIRRDGLLFSDSNGAATEWVIPSEIVQCLEQQSWEDLPPESEYFARIADIETEYFGIPPSSPELIFSAPLTIQWDITSRCNLKCKHCYADATTETGYELSKEEVFRVIEEAGRIGVMALHILGGEPFARRDLVEIIQYACQHDLACHVSSNGTLIRSKHARALKGLQNVTIDVSIDSTQPARHDWFRGQEGAYKRAIEGIRHLQEQDILVGTTCTIHADTLDEMPLIAQQAVDLGLHRLQYLFVSPVGRALQYQDELLLSEEGTQTFTNRFLELTEKYEGVIRIDSPVVPQEPKQAVHSHSQRNDFWLTGCLAGIDKLAICSDGLVTICPQLDIVYGNVRFLTIEEIWADLHSKRLAQLGKGCEICNFDGYCGGGCPAPNSYKNELAPCYGRRPVITTIDQAGEFASEDCFTLCSFPCACPGDCRLPCLCPGDCRLPCPCPGDCRLPCLCPVDCRLPCNFPCLCPGDCRFPCACPTHCPLPR